MTTQPAARVQSQPARSAAQRRLAALQQERLPMQSEEGDRLLRQVDRLVLNTSKRCRKRTPPDQDVSPLWELDDSSPAGPYPQPIDSFGLRLLCLATIRQAILDIKSARNPDVVFRARQFLAGQAKDWLKAMHIFRRGGEGVVYDLIYKGDYQQLALLLEEEPEPA